MWTVVLVEDEILVRESIKQIIPWEELGFKVIAEASDGEQALTHIRQHAPDLVITDIIMPFMDGVELLKTARSEGYDSRFIVLSCMSDFEYVRDAMAYGASNYILKLSMNVDSLKEALQKVRDELLQNTSMKTAAIQQYYERIWRYIGEDILHQQASEDVRFPLSKYESLKFIAVAMLHGAERMDDELLSQCEWCQHIQPKTVHTFTKWGHTTFVCGFTSEQEAQSFHDALKGAPASDLPYPTVCGPIVDVAQLSYAWQHVLQQLNHFWYASERGLIFAGEVGDRADGDDHHVDELWALERTMIQQFEQMKTEACADTAHRLFDTFAKQSEMMYVVKATVLRLVQTFSRMMNTPFKWKEDIVQCATHEQLLHMMLQIIRTKLAQWERDYKPYSNHPEINKVIDYIRMNYNQDLTVKSLAKLVALDEKYLSRLFKMKTGESLIHYVQRVRIRKAENYLRTTDLSVSEIGAMVGFNNDNYFIKIFRRWNEQTPSQYRRATK